jgi:hypothetical protein
MLRPKRFGVDVGSAAAGTVGAAVEVMEGATVGRGVGCGVGVVAQFVRIHEHANKRSNLIFIRTPAKKIPLQVYVSRQNARDSTTESSRVNVSRKLRDITEIFQAVDYLFLLPFGITFFRFRIAFRASPKLYGA